MATAVMAPAAIMALMTTPTLTVTLTPPTLTITVAPMPPTQTITVTLMPPTLAITAAFMPTLAITVATPTAATSPDDRRCFLATTAGKLRCVDQIADENNGTGLFGLRAFLVEQALWPQEKTPLAGGIGSERGKVQAVLGGGMSPRE